MLVTGETGWGRRKARWELSVPPAHFSVNLKLLYKMKSINLKISEQIGVSLTGGVAGREFGKVGFDEFCRSFCQAFSLYVVSFDHLNNHLKCVSLLLYPLVR